MDLREWCKQSATTARRIVRVGTMAAFRSHDMLLSNIKIWRRLLPVSSRACTLEDLNLFLPFRNLPPRFVAL